MVHINLIDNHTILLYLLYLFTVPNIFITFITFSSIKFQTKDVKNKQTSKYKFVALTCGIICTMANYC